jgi:hypothetical protein
MRINFTLENLVSVPNVASWDAEVTLTVKWYQGDDECASYSEVTDWKVTSLTKYDDLGNEVLTCQMCALEEEFRDEINAAISLWVNSNESQINEKAGEKYADDDAAAREAYWDAKFEQSRCG